MKFQKGLLTGVKQFSGFSASSAELLETRNNWQKLNTKIMTLKTLRTGMHLPELGLRLNLSLLPGSQLQLAAQLLLLVDPRRDKVGEHDEKGEH